MALDANSSKVKLSKDAEQLLEQLNATVTEVDTINLGDRSLLPYDLTNERESLIASMFGAAFAEQAFALPINSWQGPITSEYGVHLIYINSRTEAQLPQLADIRERVARKWRSTKQHEANEIFYQSLHQRYEIVLDDGIRKDAMASIEQ